MSFFKPANRAESADRLAGLTGLGTGLAGLIYVAGAAQPLVDAETAALLDMAQLIGGLAILIGFLPLFFFFKTRFGGQPVNPWKTDGFMSAVVRRAGFTAFAAGMLAMIVLTMLDNLILERITAEILLDAIIAFALLVFSASFFLFSRGGADEAEA